MIQEIRDLDSFVAPHRLALEFINSIGQQPTKTSLQRQVCSLG